MDDTIKLTQEANKYRVNKDYNRALPLYSDVWVRTHDIYAGTGLLHCLRKTNRIDDAIQMSDDLLQYEKILDWTKNEILWLYISNVIKEEGASISLKKGIAIASKLMNLNPDDIKRNNIVFWVLKLANNYKDWKVLNEWVNKIDKDKLDDVPISIDGKEGWSNKARWYNYRIKGLIQQEPFDKIIYDSLINDAMNFFPKQRKYFIRLKALALTKLKEYDEAEKIYNQLCSSNYKDWWIIHEYAQLKYEIGNKEDALRLMYMAANEKGKIEAKVQLIKDIASVCEELGLFDISLKHYLLFKYTREKNTWKIEDELSSKISELIRKYNLETIENFKETLSYCCNIWKDKADEDEAVKNNTNTIGFIQFGKQENSFCFIKSSNDSIFCFKKDLPNEVKHGSKVVFETEPFYDRKKDKESVRAVNIRLLS